MTDLINKGYSKSLKNPLVSICCITYNHEKFISQAIDGFLMQRTDFPIEILIHDDASTDGTTEIIKKYENEYPDLIHAVYQTENQYSIGNKIINFLFEMVRGRYIALCEGDDYWTDPLKLQKQVDFLENNRNFVLCLHNVLWVWEDSTKPSEIREKKPKDVYSFVDHLNPPERATLGHTCSAVFRGEIIKKLPQFFLKSLHGDVPLFIYIGNHGLTRYFKETMAVKRVHFSSMTSRRMNMELLLNKAWMYEAIDRYFRYKFHKEIEPNLEKYYKKILAFTKKTKYLIYYKYWIKLVFLKLINKIT